MSGRGQWQQAVEFGAQGRYLVAWEVLDRLATTDLPESEHSRLHSLRGSHLRQVGAIDLARSADEAGLQCASDAASLTEALLGLAADFVAGGQLDIASGYLERAAAEAGASEPGPEVWRIRTRLHWVHAEYQLLVGDVAASLVHAQAALHECAQVSERHLIKSTAILAAVEIAHQSPESALDRVQAVFDLARQRGLATLVWPLALIGMDAVDSAALTVDARPITRWIRAGALATRTIEAHLPEPLARSWSARSDVGRLRARFGG